MSKVLYKMSIIAVFMLLCLSCSDSDGDGDRLNPGNAVLSIDVSGITETEAGVTVLLPSQGDVATVKVAEIIKKSDFEGDLSNLRQRVDYAISKGTEQEMPYNKWLSALVPETEYVCLAVGLDASGKAIVSFYKEFKTLKENYGSFSDENSAGEIGENNW